MRTIVLFIALGFSLCAKAQQNVPTAAFTQAHAYSVAFSNDEKSSSLLDAASLIPNWESALADGNAEDLDLTAFYTAHAPNAQFQHFKIANSGYVITIIPAARVQQLYNRSLIKSKK